MEFMEFNSETWNMGLMNIVLGDITSLWIDQIGRQVAEQRVFMEKAHLKLAG